MRLTIGVLALLAALSLSGVGRADALHPSTCNDYFLQCEQDCNGWDPRCLSNCQSSLTFCPQRGFFRSYRRDVDFPVKQ